jgi:uncharacterized protein
MFDETILQTPGEHHLLLDGNVGILEVVLSIPQQIKHDVIALIGHPHSLQGGSMNNKVVTTMSRTFRDLGIVNCRFNFRGVGQSGGEYDKGIGESEDMLLILKQLKQQLPHREVIIAGFSFGSYVAYRTACQVKHKALISVAPPIHHYDYTEFAIPNPWIVIQGLEDEVVPASVVLEFFQDIIPAVSMLEFEQTGHFFHGKLVELKRRLTSALEAIL